MNKGSAATEISSKDVFMIMTMMMMTLIDDDDDRIHRCLKEKTEEVTEDAEILSKAMLAQLHIDSTNSLYMP